MEENKIDEFVSGIIFLEAQRLIPTTKEVKAYKKDINSKEGYTVSLKYIFEGVEVYLNFNILRKYLIDVGEMLQYNKEQLEIKINEINQNYSKNHPFRKELIDLMTNQILKKEFHLLGEYIQGSNYSKDIENIYMKELNPLKCLKKANQIKLKDSNNEIIKKDRKIRALSLVKKIVKTKVS